MRPPLALLLTTALLAPSAFADDDHHRALRVPTLPQYQQECAACHMAYPPGMLPAASWTRLMGGLDKHYGTDASLDAASVKLITRWLTDNAGTGRRVSATPPPEDRITRSAWFIRQHDEVGASVAGHAVGRALDRGAFPDAGADKGDFDEDRVRIPK